MYALSLLLETKQLLEFVGNQAIFIRYSTVMLIQQGLLYNSTIHATREHTFPLTHHHIMHIIIKNHILFLLTITITHNN